MATSGLGVTQSDAASDNGAYYPRLLTSDAGTVLVHAPQVESWEDFSEIKADIAIEVTPVGEDLASVGTVHVTADSQVDIERRTVILTNLQIDEIYFMSANAAKLKAVLTETMSSKTKLLPLDVVVRALPKDLAVNAEPNIKNAPPKIIVSTKPAVMVAIDGDPITVPVDGTTLEFVVNTNWDLFRETVSDEWYLRNENTWVKAPSLDGKWKKTKKLPPTFSDIPPDANWDAVRAEIPPKKDNQKFSVIVSDKPTELIVIDGKPQYENIPKTTLQFITNTDSDIFRLDDRIYYLVAGRWFAAGDLKGPWSNVTKLPDEFLKIPAEHETGDVRASVAGTEEAWLAVIESQIPRKAVIKRDAGKNIEVAYAGDPQFEQIENLALSRAVNTSYQVLKVNNSYYLCYNAIWFVSEMPNGPWVIADSIPSIIYKIPPSSPAYNVTFVEVYDSDDESITTGYTSGYEGINVTTSYTVVYGTGWYYPNYYYYPVYYGYPTTYGYGAWYNPATGAYGQRSAAYGPYGGAAATSIYNPRTGGYLHGESVWDSDEMARSGYGYNPRTDTGFAADRYYDFDDNEGWGESVISRGDDWIHTESQIEGKTITTDVETSGGLTGTSTRERDDGHISGEGQFEKDGRTITTQTEGTLGSSTTDFQTSDGVTGEVTRNVEDGQMNREISVDNGQSITSQTERTGQGTRTEFESEAGGKGTVVRSGSDTAGVARSAEGDLYAGKNGEVYKKTDSGWSRKSDSGWQEVGGTRQREEAATAAGRSGSYKSSLPQSGRSLGSSTTGSQMNSLNRQHNARQQGYRSYGNYQNRQRAGGGMRRQPRGRRGRR